MNPPFAALRMGHPAERGPTMSRNHIRLLTYIIGLTVTILSYVVFRHIGADRGSLLAWLVLVTGRNLGFGLTSAKMSVGVVIASALVSVIFFLPEELLVQNKSRILRDIGFVIAAAIVFGCAYWGSTPSAFYDPMPGSLAK
jgi:hypothetical protein